MQNYGSEPIIPLQLGGSLGVSARITWLIAVLGMSLAAGAIAVVVIFIGLPTERQNAATIGWVEHSQEVISVVGNVLASANDAETGQRGFLLTGNPALLAPYDTGIESVWRNFDAVQRLTADNPSQQSRLEILHQQLEQRMTLLARTIELARGGNVPAATEIVRTAGGKAIMGGLRTTGADMVHEEEGLLSLRRAEYVRELRQSDETLVGLLVLGALGILLTGVTVARASLARTAKRNAASSSAERLRLLNLVNFAPMMMSDMDGIISFWSEGCRQIFGWTAEQAIGRSAEDLLDAVSIASPEVITTALVRKGEWRGEFRARTRDGADLVILSHKYLQHAGRGGTPKAAGIAAVRVRGMSRDLHSGTVLETVSDVTEVRRFEAELRGSQARFRSVVDAAADGIIVARSDGTINSVNRAALSMFGYDRVEELIGRDLDVLLPAGEGAKHGAFIAGHQAGAPPSAIGVPGRELLALRRDRTEFPIDLSVSSFGTGDERYLTGIIRDASDRRLTEAALRDSEVRLRLFIDGAPAAIAMFDNDMCYLAASRRFVSDYQIDGRIAASLIGRSHYAVFPERLQDGRAIHARVLAGETMSAEAEPFPRVDGGTSWVRWEMVPWRNGDGRIGGALLFSEDVTGHTVAEAALRESEARLRIVQQISHVGYFAGMAYEPAGLISDEFVEIYGLPPEHTRLSMVEFYGLLHADDRKRVEAATSYFLAQPYGEFTIEYRIHRRSDGALRWIVMKAEGSPGAVGQVDSIISAHQDITKAAEMREILVVRSDELEERVDERTAELIAVELRYRLNFEHSPVPLFTLDEDNVITGASESWLALLGYARDATVGRPITDFMTPGSIPLTIAERAVFEANGVIEDVERHYVHRDGRVIEALVSKRSDGHMVVAAVVDISARRRAEAALLASEEHLRQAQKMQALGQLAAGIAHDFNNILQTVSGATALIERRPDDKDKVSRLARTAANAAARGASITQRLLSFARRGELHAEAISTAEFIESAREVLTHTLDTTITVHTDVPRNLPPLTADRGQLDTAVINIGTNARDAMANGGTLTLSAAAEHIGEGDANPAGLAPGDYVRLSIADNGIGMDAATLARVSEPFFTTKPTGQGTGLGLAMVRGFAEQSGGAFSITSKLGAGTTVTIWLRQAAGDDRQVSTRDVPVKPISTALPARILLVDDDSLIRETLAASLEDLGFATLVAASGQEALALLRSGEVVDAMVSDLSMPDMNGVVTIDRALALRPSLPCFLLTGYVGERAALSPKNAFTLVHKPVSGQALAAQIEARLVKALV